MEEIYFSTGNFLPVVWVCLAIAVAGIVWLLAVVRNRIGLCRKSAGDEPEAGAQPGDWPGVSVIVYADDAPGRLRRLLEKLFSQRYAGRMEVIVVNDGASSEVTDVVNLLMPEHRELYQTFVPDEAHNLSRKKLGISLGVKAARNEFVVITSDRCMPESDGWLMAMTGPFRRGKDVAIGFARVEGLKSGADRFDEVATAVTWLSAGLRSEPYRGTGYNIGYRRSLFFDAKGFSRSLTLHNGDDDIFVNQIANGENCEVVLSRESRMWVDFHNVRKGFRDERLNHCFTARFLPKGSRRFFGLATVVMWAVVAAVVTGVVFSLPNALGACVMVALLPVALVPMALAWRGAGRALGVRLGGWTAGWQMLWRWIRTLRFAMVCGSSDRKNYTWHQG